MKKNILFIASTITLCSAGLLSAAGLHLKNISNTAITFELILTNNEIRKGTLRHGEIANVDAFFEGFKTITVMHPRTADAMASTIYISLDIPGLTAWSDITFGTQSIIGDINVADSKRILFEKPYIATNIGGNRP